MEKINLESTRVTLEKSMLSLHKELEDFRLSNKLNGRLGIGAHILGIDKAVVGWIDYLPHIDPNEEGLVIEFGVDVYFEDKPSSISIWLGWTHGEVIKEYFWEKPIECINENQLANDAKKLFEGLKDQMLVDMKTEMIVERPPVHRND